MGGFFRTRATNFAAPRERARWVAATAALACAPCCACCTGNMEGAKIYAQNAIRKKNEALNYLRLGSRLDAVVARLNTQANMQVGAAAGGRAQIPWVTSKTQRHRSLGLFACYRAAQHAGQHADGAGGAARGCICSMRVGGRQQVARLNAEARCARVAGSRWALGLLCPAEAAAAAARRSGLWRLVLRRRGGAAQHGEFARRGGACRASAEPARILPLLLPLCLPLRYRAGCVQKHGQHRKVAGKGAEHQQH